MRFARALVAVLALALVALLASFTAPAQAMTADRTTPAAKASEYRSGSEYRSEPARAAKPKITVRIVKRNGGQLWLVGGVEPPKGPVYVQKATSCNRQTGTCNFKFYRKIYLKKGRYETRVYAPKKGSWAWRTKVGSTTSKIWVTCKLRNGQQQCPVP